MKSGAKKTPQKMRIITQIKKIMKVIQITLGQLTQSTIHTITKYPNKIFATITINNYHKIKIKVDMGSDLCILMSEQMRQLPFKPEIKDTHTILKGYKRSEI